MESDKERSKINAIYDLREAVESKVRAEVDLEAGSSAVARDALLAAQLEVEAKTQDAIDVCHECGGQHVGDDAHGGAPRISGRQDNVVHVDFRRDSEIA